MKIKLTSEEELLNVCADAIHVLSNLRHFTKKWDQEYGYELRRRKQYYEEKADELLEKLQVKENRHSRDIEIEINNNL